MTNREINLILDANMSAIQEVYSHYLSKTTKKPPIEAMMEMMSQEMKIHMSPKDATYCYGMSLMTSPDIFKNCHVNQEHISFVEFLEMIVRMADLHFYENEDDSTADKLKFILDDMLDLVGKQRSDFNPFMSDAESSEDEAGAIGKTQLFR
jgi:hypothetical protein